MYFNKSTSQSFIDAGGEVFSNLDKNTFPKYTLPQGKVYCGIDLGKQEDYTVATFVDSTGKVVDIYRANAQEWTTMTQEIIKRAQRWNATLMVEVNSIGDVIYEQIKRQWQDTHPFTTSSKSKQEIIEGLILDMNESIIRIPSRELFSWLWDELTVYTYEYNPKTRSLRYGHPKWST
jgi:hypothetical protein